MFEERFYRDLMKIDGFLNFTVIEKESDLHISSKLRLEKEARDCLIRYRQDIIDYIKNDLNFHKSLVPIDVPHTAPKIVTHMAYAARCADVGPMAAVAGAISEYVGIELLKYTDEVIVENGGDIFIKSNRDTKILVYAGRSPFSNKIALSISASDTPLGICTSAGTVGHSLSFGKSDAVVILSKDTLVADAAATSVGNIVVTPDDINPAIEYARSIKGVEGVLIIISDKMGAWGKVTLVRP